MACALAGDPELLFLDEPTTGLDPQARRQLWDLVEDLKRSRRTVILTTHYMDEAERLCDRIAVMDRGRVIATGTPRELVASLGAEHVVEFGVEGAAPDDPTLASLPGVSGVTHRDGHIALATAELHATVPALLDRLRATDTELTLLTTHSATLEDVFVSLTGRHLRDA